MKKELYIGIPSLGTVPMRFALSLMGMRLPDNTKIMTTERVMIDSARNIIAQKAIDRGFEYLFFIDDDMVFDSNIYYDLKSHDKDVIGALAFKRAAPFDPCVHKKGRNGLFYSFLPKKLTKVDGIGAAGLLIKTKVLEEIPFPWFETSYDKDGNHWSVDLDFSKKVTKAGFEIWCDPNIEMGHVGRSPTIKKQHFLKSVDISKFKKDE